MKRFIEFIKYTWKAKGRHGIHSPFVYDLVEHCFHIPLKNKVHGALTGTMKQHKKSLSLLLQLVQHFQISTLASHHHYLKDLEKLLAAQELNCVTHSLTALDALSFQNVSLVYFPLDHTNDSDFEALLTMISKLNEQTLILIDGIRNTAAIQQSWRKIISNDSIHFTADLYSFGLLSKRPQQVKEHFVLRY